MVDDEPVGIAVGGGANALSLQPVLNSRPHTRGSIRLFAFCSAYCLLPFAYCLLPIACSMVVEPVGNAVDDVPHRFGASRPVAPSRVIDLGPLLVSCSADFLPDLCEDGGSAIVVLSGCPPDGIGG